MVVSSARPKSSPHIDVRKTLREPDSLMEFPAKTGLKVSSKDKEEFGIRDLLAKKEEHLFEALAEIDERVLKGGDGSGVNFILPMTAMAHFGDFLTGALKVIAPKAKVSLLPTAGYKDSSLWNPGPKRDAVDASLKERLEKAIRAGDETFVIIDDMPYDDRGNDRRVFKDLSVYNYSGITVDEISRHLPQKPILMNFLNWKLFKAEDGLDKDIHGGFWMGPGHGLDYFEKRPYTVGESNWLKRGGCSILDHLMTYRKHYFTEGETDRYLRNERGDLKYIKRMDFYAEDVRGISVSGRIDLSFTPLDERVNTREGKLQLRREIAEEYDGMPPERLDEIVRKLKRDDALTRRGLSMYGVACAKDYLRLHGRARLEANGLGLAGLVWARKDEIFTKRSTDDGAVQKTLLSGEEVRQISSSAGDKVGPEHVLDYMRWMDRIRRNTLINDLHKISNDSEQGILPHQIIQLKILLEGEQKAEKDT